MEILNETKFLSQLFKNSIEAQNTYYQLLNKKYQKEGITLPIVEGARKNYFNDLVCYRR